MKLMFFKKKWIKTLY